jgi:DNA invertase Pin-like site-specific DNA recombinase
MAELSDVVVYLRMSDLSQDTSIEQQLEQITALTRRENYRIAKVYKDEGKSGSHSVQKRIGFLSMLADISAGKYPGLKAVCCLDISRFGRLDSIDGAFAKQTLREIGVILHTVLDGAIDWRVQTSRIVDAVLSEAQHDYSVRLGQKTLKGKLRAFQQGDFFGYKIPYGFARRLTAEDGSQHIVPRIEKFSKPKGWRGEVILGAQEEIDVVLWMFKKFDSLDIGYRWLASKMNLKGIPSPTGKKWHSKVVQEILQNEKYIGDLTLGESGDGKFWRLQGDEIVRAEGKEGQKKTPLLLKGFLPIIVPVDLFERVQKKIKARKVTGQHGAREGGYLLKGILFCGSCGRPLYGNHNTSKPDTAKRKSGKTIYVCKTAINYGKSCDCGQWSVIEHEMLEFLSFYGTQLIEPEEVDRARETTCPAAPSKDIPRLQRALSEIRKRIERGTENFLLADPEHTAECDAKLKEWKAERAALEAELSDLQATDSERAEQDKLIELRKTLLALPIIDGNELGELSIEKEHFRQLLLATDCRVDIWWKRSSAKRWEVAKVRLRIGQRHIEFDGSSPHKFTFASLMV